MNKNNTLGLRVDIEQTTHKMCGMGANGVSDFINVYELGKTPIEGLLYKEEASCNKIGKLKPIIKF